MDDSRDEISYASNGFFIKVVVILRISDDVVVRIDVIEFVWLIGEKIYRGIGLVYFFIGIDYVRLYIGETK